MSTTTLESSGLLFLIRVHNADFLVYQQLFIFESKLLLEFAIFFWCNSIDLLNYDTKLNFPNQLDTAGSSSINRMIQPLQKLRKKNNKKSDVLNQ